MKSFAGRISAPNLSIPTPRAARPTRLEDDTAADRLLEAEAASGFAWSAVVEAAGLVAAMIVLNAVFGDGHRMIGMQPHPFGLVVLLVAAQYGLAEAAVAALLCTVALYAFNPIPQSFGENYYGWLAAASLTPLLWFGIALVVGAITARARGHRVELAVAARAAKADLTAMVETNGQLAATVSVLEGRIAGQLSTVSAIYEAARGIGTDRASVLRGAPGLVRAATRCTKCSVFTLEAGALKLAVSDGWQASEPFARVIEQGPLFDRVIVARETLVAHRPSDAIALGGEGILAGPILDPHDGGLIGMLKIEAIPFATLNLDTVANFMAAAEWLGMGFSQARAREVAEVDRFLAEEGLVAHSHLERVIGLMTAVSQRIGFDLPMLRIDLPALRAQDKASDTLLSAMRRVFRTSDIMLEASAVGRSFSVLMPGTSPDTSHIVASRLLNAVRTVDPNLADIIGITTVVLHKAKAESEDEPVGSGAIARIA